MNGTVYRTVGSLAEACAGCTKDGERCSSWRQESATSFALQQNSSEVNQDPNHFVVSGEKLSGHNEYSRCWYDASANASFAPYCSKANLGLGRIVALRRCSSTPYQIHCHNRYLFY